MTDRDDASDVYYDPFDFSIDDDPYPVWARMREEQPLYFNEKYGFWALSRFQDVERGCVDWRTYSSARGTLLELIQAEVEMPPGSIIFEDPPSHDLHRGVLSRVFTPRKMNAIEPQIRAFCARTLDPLVGTGGFDFVRDLGAEMPMRTIGMLLGIPESDQAALRERVDRSMKLTTDGEPPEVNRLTSATMSEVLGDYIDWRTEHPSDDVMTELLHAELTDADGSVRRLGRHEIVNFVNLLAAAGNETTARLIGWAGKVLAEHPDQRRELAADPGLVPNTIEELLRYEAPSPVNARYMTADAEWYGRTVPAGSVMLFLNGAANRDHRKFPDGERFDLHRKIDHHLSFGYGIHFCLGAALARMEGRIALDEVMRRWPEWEVDWDNAVRARTSTVRGWERLPVVVP
jgi:cytochrome P450